MTMTADHAANATSTNSGCTSPLLLDDELASKYKDDDTPSKGEKFDSASPAAMKNQVTISILVFFFAMIAHELALEAVSSNFHELDSLASAVTLFQFGFCFLLPFIVSKGKVCETFPKTIKEFVPYTRLSFLVFGATGLATHSLKYVSYPTKVIFKSAKLIPTMLISTLFYKNKKHTSLEYFSAFLICLGAAGYSYNGGGGGGSGPSNDTSYFGVGLLSVSILCDAIVPNVQKNLMTISLPRTSTTDADSVISLGLSAQAVMVNTNAVGFGILLVYMLVSGSLSDAVSTAMLHPKLLLYLVSVGLGLSSAVLAYTTLIKRTSPVVAVAVATLRKVATIMLSYIIFPKIISGIHVIAGVLVLVGVFLSTFCRRR
mmetsp:Transcript_23906/g.35449  ORF Transcript_23906/g.35449 Transcript_23906/m.35449 type:complete len:373 (+) Transcript_23906:39-1157(+)